VPKTRVARLGDDANRWHDWAALVRPTGGMVIRGCWSSWSFGRAFWSRFLGTAVAEFSNFLCLLTCSFIPLFIPSFIFSFVRSLSRRTSHSPGFVTFLTSSPLFEHQNGSLQLYVSPTSPHHLILTLPANGMDSLEKAQPTVQQYPVNPDHTGGPNATPPLPQ
jgi:hypothetical protein